MFAVVPVMGRMVRRLLEPLWSLWQDFRLALQLQGSRGKYAVTVSVLECWDLLLTVK